MDASPGLWLSPQAARFARLHLGVDGPTGVGAKARRVATQIGLNQRVATAAVAELSPLSDARTRTRMSTHFARQTLAAGAAELTIIRDGALTRQHDKPQLNGEIETRLDDRKASRRTATDRSRRSDGEIAPPRRKQSAAPRAPNHPGVKRERSASGRPPMTKQRVVRNYRGQA